MNSTTGLNDAETEIAQFFQRRVRERITFLLSSKKRRELFDKLAHIAEDCIDGRQIVEKNRFPFDPRDIAERLGKRVYVVCPFELDGRYADIKTALDELWSCGSPYLLYGNGLLYVETEYDFSVHAAYMLKR